MLENYLNGEWWKIPMTLEYRKCYRGGNVLWLSFYLIFGENLCIFSTHREWRSNYEVCSGISLKVENLIAALFLPVHGIGRHCGGWYWKPKGFRVWRKNRFPNLHWNMVFCWESFLWLQVEALDISSILLPSSFRWKFLR